MNYSRINKNLDTCKEKKVKINIYLRMEYEIPFRFSWNFTHGLWHFYINNKL